MPLEVGTLGWWENESKEVIYLKISNLVFDHYISPSKAVELLQFAEDPRGDVPPCCWEKLDEVNQEPEYESRDVFKLVLDFFKGDKEKTDLWFKSENPLLGGISAATMIECGRYDRLLSIVKTALAENEAPKTAPKK